jgi:hypothetical protein
MGWIREARGGEGGFCHPGRARVQAAYYSYCSKNLQIEEALL